MQLAGAHRTMRATAAVFFIAAIVGPTTADALDVPDDPVTKSSMPLELRARNRAIDAFNEGTSKKKKHRYKWAGKPAIVLKYERPLQLNGRDMIFEVKVPGRKKTWARFRLKF
ncbi:MAG: hypothetical protein ACQGVK_25395 [Myxococcota bacterium]